MSFAVYSFNSRVGSSGTGPGGGGSAGSGDLLLNFSVSANGATGRSLPENALVKGIVLQGDAAATVRFGSAGQPELLVPDTTIAAGIRESWAPFISIPGLMPIVAAGIVGTVSITFVYQIVPV